MGIGLHSGEVLAGVGAIENEFYPTLDELVTRAMRYSEGANRGEVVLSQSVFAHLYPKVDVSARTLRATTLDPQPEVDGYILRRWREAEPVQEA